MERILIVEDSGAQRTVLKDKLLARDFSVVEAASGEEATNKLVSEEISAVILDWELPDTKGPDLLKHWLDQFSKKISYTPVLMLTGKTNSQSIQTAIEAGAMDYIKKPACDVELFARLENALRMRRLQLQLVDFALRDPLTKLYNRRHLQEVMHHEWELYKSEAIPCSCAILDIDFFKKINDKFGHQVGDDVLQKMAQILMVKSRNQDTVARYGGEEFVICYPNTSGQKANLLAIRTLEEVRKFDWSQIAEGLEVTFSCGVSELKPETQSVEHWLNKADGTLYIVKEIGRNNVLLDSNAERFKRKAS